MILMMDVDGVLVRGRPGGGHWMQDLHHDLGLDPDRLRAGFFATHWEEIVTGRADLMPRLRAWLATQPGAPEAEALKAYWFAKDAALDAALVTALLGLRAEGLRIRLATSQEHLRAAHLMGPLGLDRLAEAIHHSAALGLRKPDPAFFEAVRRETGLASGAHLLVDDDARNVEAARAAGWQAMRWTGPGDLPALLARLAPA